MNEKILVEKIKKYFLDYRQLGKKINPHTKSVGVRIKLKNIRYLGGGNHFNFLLKTGKGNFVLRIAKPEALDAGALFDIPGATTSAVAKGDNNQSTEGKPYLLCSKIITRINTQTYCPAEVVAPGIPDEFTLLKLIEKYGVAPKAIAIDLENFELPLLIEKFINGKKYSSYKKLSEKQIKEAMKLMVKVSGIKLSPEKFPFRFSYMNHETSIKGWKWRLNEIKKLGHGRKKISQIVKKFKPIINKAAKILLQNKKLLNAAKLSFIYNDAHGGNTLWLGKKAIFIDWQKVSLGDPTFMPAVFALAIEKKFPYRGKEFFMWFAKEYNKLVRIKNFERLFKLRILEREVANMLWVVWEALKLGNNLPFKKLENYERFKRVQKFFK